MSEILRAKGLKKYFGSFKAINGVDLNLESGIITSIIGPNGAGKTTLINLLTGDFHPDSGKIFFEGNDITHLPINKRVKKGICRSFQVLEVFKSLNVFENICLPVLSRLNKQQKFFCSLDGYSEVVKETEEILKEMLLWDKKGLPAGKISHGDQKFLETAMAIALKPKLCFLDEPSAGLSPPESVKTMEVIKRLSVGSGITFVIVEHDMDLVFSLSERIVVMSKGEILAEGDPDQIRGNKAVREIYLGEG